jgi:hypothetical protein
MGGKRQKRKREGEDVAVKEKETGAEEQRE